MSIGGIAGGVRWLRAGHGLGRERGLGAVLVLGLVAVGWLAAVRPPVARACSPPFEEPTIAALGPDQVVVLGTTGEPVPGGRLFHVHRWFNGGVPTTPIVIAFKEGEPTGDCSYPVSAGLDLIIAPVLEPDGRLTADMVTLQADPTSDAGRRYLAEAEALFGPGVVPAATEGGGSGSSAAIVPVGLVAAAVAVAVVVLFATVLWAARRQRVRPRDSR